MPVVFVVLTLALSLAGCATENQVQGVSSYMNLSPVEDAIYETLSREPVPLPATTPYDADKLKRGVYIRGFLDGWHDVISGVALHGTHGTPATLSPELAKIWQAGWEAGYKPASERWFQEYLRIRQESARAVLGHGNRTVSVINSKRVSATLMAD